jgi:hypothetical protein
VADGLPEQAQHHRQTDTVRKKKAASLMAGDPQIGGLGFQGIASGRIAFLLRLLGDKERAISFQIEAAQTKIDGALA